MPAETKVNEDPGAVRRRDFIRQTGLGAVAALAMPDVAAPVPAGNAAASARVAFNTANLVGRVTDYRYKLANWMDQHNKTIAATDAAAWRDICREIAEAGFKSVEVWEAHASPATLDQGKAADGRRELERFGLKPVAYAGRLTRATLEVCKWLEIPHIDGGLGNLSPEQATALCEEFGIGFNIENHPEKSAQEILKKIGGGNRWLGVCIDTGWLGTQGVSAPEVIKACGSLVRHVHIKDVKSAGTHETCLLGEGVVGIAECLRALHSLHYAGSYSWEDEPEDRNPFDSAKRNLRWIMEHL